MQVAAAKAAHFAEKARLSGYVAAAPAAPLVAAPYYAYPYGPAPVWQGPYAIPVVTPEGFLADTPEVVAARAAHLAEVARAEAQA